MHSKNAHKHLPGTTLGSQNTSNSSVLRSNVENGPHFPNNTMLVNQSSVSIKGQTNKIGRTETPVQTFKKNNHPLQPFQTFSLQCAAAPKEMTRPTISLPKECTKTISNPINTLNSISDQYWKSQIPPSQKWDSTEIVSRRFL